MLRNSPISSSQVEHITPQENTSDLGFNDSNNYTKHNSSKFSLGAIASSILSIVALVGLTMMLAGYGVAIAVENQFGIPHATIFKSSFDLLSLSVWFMTWILTNSLENLRTIFLNSSYWKSAAWLACFGMMGFALGLGAFYLKLQLEKTKSRQRFANLKKRKKMIVVAIGTLGAGVGSAAIALIGWPLFLWIALTFTALIGAIPMISLGAGENHIQEYVIKPIRCFNTSNREERLKDFESQSADAKKERVATCVKVLDGKDIVASGRVVFSTTELIVLYDPATGNVTRESIDGRSIQITSTLQ